jgi:hypothetical protein
MRTFDDEKSQHLARDFSWASSGNSRLDYLYPYVGAICGGTGVP